MFARRGEGGFEEISYAVTPETVQLRTASRHSPGIPRGPGKSAVGGRANAPREPELSPPDPDWRLAHVMTNKGLSRARNATLLALSVESTEGPTLNRCPVQRLRANDGGLDYYKVAFNPGGSLS